MATAATRKYPVEPRERGAAVPGSGAEAGDPVDSAAVRRCALTEVHPEVLRNWIRQDEAIGGERHENRRLRAEVKEVLAANEVLKAASAYFASESGQARRQS